MRGMDHEGYMDHEGLWCMLVTGCFCFCCRHALRHSSLQVSYHELEIA